MGPSGLIPLFARGHVGWGLPLKRRQHGLNRGRATAWDLEARFKLAGIRPIPASVNMGIPVQSPQR